jgi:predicted PurR-regulated permease PerM
MALPVSLQLRYWGVAAVVLGLVLWLLDDTLLPFILGGAIAYLLDPIADRMERWGMSRLLATSVITLGAIFVFVLAVLLIVPLLVQQAISLFNTAPQIAADLWTFLTTRFPDLLDDNSTIRQSLTGLGETIQARGGALVNGLAASLNSIVNIMVLIVVVPVVAFYLLLDWDNLVAQIDELIPRDHLENVRKSGPRDRRHPRLFHPRTRNGLLYSRALLRTCVNARRAELWHCRRICGWLDLLYSLCWRLGGRWAGAGFGAVPILG